MVTITITRLMNANADPFVCGGVEPKVASLRAAVQSALHRESFRGCRETKNPWGPCRHHERDRHLLQAQAIIDGRLQHSHLFRIEFVAAPTRHEPYSRSTNQGG